MIPWRAVVTAGWVLTLGGIAVMLYGPFWIGLGLYLAGALTAIRAAIERPGLYRGRRRD